MKYLKLLIFCFTAVINCSNATENKVFDETAAIEDKVFDEPAKDLVLPPQNVEVQPFSTSSQNGVNSGAPSSLSPNASQSNTSTFCSPPPPGVGRGSTSPSAECLFNDMAANKKSQSPSDAIYRSMASAKFHSQSPPSSKKSSSPSPLMTINVNQSAPPPNSPTSGSSGQFSSSPPPSAFSSSVSTTSECLRHLRVNITTSSGDSHSLPPPAPNFTSPK